MWLETEDGRVALSDWRVDLLQAVDRYGSLAEAARQLGVPYKTAWYKLKEIEAGLGVALLHSSSGGARHGSAMLTDAGRRAVALYQAIAEGIDGEVRSRFEAQFSEPLG
ncbi:MAG TPA: LysR family transcriptional regulator [Chloroflexota bacterium]